MASEQARIIRILPVLECFGQWEDDRGVCKGSSRFSVLSKSLHMQCGGVKVQLIRVPGLIQPLVSAIIHSLSSLAGTGSTI